MYPLSERTSSRVVDMTYHSREYHYQWLRNELVGVESIRLVVAVLSRLRAWPKMKRRLRSGWVCGDLHRAVCYSGCRGDGRLGLFSKGGWEFVDGTTLG
jgi:hypothetical protein